MKKFILILIILLNTNCSTSSSKIETLFLDNIKGIYLHGGREFTITDGNSFKIDDTTYNFQSVYYQDRALYKKYNNKNQVYVILTIAEKTVNSSDDAKTIDDISQVAHRNRIFLYEKPL